MKFANWFLLFLLAFLVLIGLLLFSTPPVNSTGTVHPKFSTMQASGESIITSTMPKWLGYGFGLGVIGLFGFSIILGLRRGKEEKNRQINRKVLVVFGLYTLMYIIMLGAYEAYHGGEFAGYFMGFPIPTAWMILGMGLAPIFMTYFYVAKFDEWVISPEEIEEFKRIKK